MLLHVLGRAEARPSVTASRESAQRRHPPRQSSIRGNLQNRDAGQRSAIRSRDASRIQNPDATQPLVPRHMGVSVQNDVDIFRDVIRRNVHEPTPDPVPFQINRERPVEIAVAISAHDRDRRPERLDRLQDSRVANIAQMPDFIHAGGKRLDLGRQFVVRVR